MARSFVKINCGHSNWIYFYIPVLMLKIIFTWKLLIGVIVPTDDVDGRTIYSIPSIGVEYAYKAEIIQYLETGTFTYDETLDDKVDPSIVNK